MASRSDAWIVEHRPDRGYLYVGRADGSERAMVVPHRKGLRLTYDKVYGGTKQPRRQYQRHLILPGEFALTHVAREIMARTGCNHDTDTYRDYARREKKLRDGLRQSGLWEQRGRLNWPLPRRLFAKLGIRQFRYTHSYARWCSVIYSGRALAKSSELLAAIKAGTLPLLHELPGFSKIGMRALTRTCLATPALWRTMVETCGAETALLLSTDNTLDEEVFQSLDPAYFSDVPALERMVQHGLSYFVEVPHREVRVAFALRDLFDRQAERIVIEQDLVGLPEAPIGFRWFNATEIRRQRCTKTANGERRTLVRERDDHHVIFDYLHSRKWSWACYGSEVSARETLQLNALAGKMPTFPFPPARVRAALLAEHVHDRLQKQYPWTWRVRGAKVRHSIAPFRRIHPERGDESHSTCEIPF